MKTNKQIDKMEFYLSIYLFIKRYFFLFLIFIVLGAAFGFYKFKTRKTYYVKEIVLYSDDISYIIIKQITSKLSYLLSSDYKSLSEQHIFEEKDLKNIKSLKTDSISLKGKIYALNTVVFGDSSGISTFTQKFSRFISNDNYAKKIISENRLRYSKMLDKLNEKLTEIEPLLNIKSVSQVGNNLYRDYFELYSKKLDLEEKLSKADNVEVIRDSTITQTSGFGLATSIIIYVLIFFVFSLLIALFIDILKKIRTYEKMK